MKQLVFCVLTSILFTACSKDSDAPSMVMLSFDGKTISFRHDPASGQEVYLQRIQSGHQVVAKKTGSDDAISVAVFQQDPRQPPGPGLYDGMVGFTYGERKFMSFAPVGGSGYKLNVTRNKDNTISGTFEGKFYEIDHANTVISSPDVKGEFRNIHLKE